MRNLAPLTGLRGIAAYTVLICHALDYPPISYGSLTGYANFGMSLFFVLSGFVIQYNYGPAFRDKGFAPATRDFVIARFARLYPLYFIGLFVSLSYVDNPIFYKSMWMALAALTLTQTIFNAQGVTGDLLGYSWSISTEVGLYLLFIALATTLTRLKRPLLLAATVLLFGMGAMIALYNHQNEILPFVPGYSWPTQVISAPGIIWLLYFSPIAQSFAFLVGALIAQFYLRRVQHKPVASGLATWSIAACAAYCVIIGALGENRSSPAFNAIQPNLIFVPAIAIVILLLCMYETFWNKILSSRLLQTMGEISYSAYLLSAFVFVGLSRSFWFSTPAVISVTRTAYVVALTTALAYGSYHLFEAPLRTWIRSLARTRSKPDLPSQASAQGPDPHMGTMSTNRLGAPTGQTPVDRISRRQVAHHLTAESES